MVSKTITSESMSAKGFSIKKFLFDDLISVIKENTKAVKIIVGAAVSIAVLYPETASIIAMLGGATYVTTRILSAIDFYCSEVKLN